MDKIEFIYNSFSPSPYFVPQSNQVTLWREGKNIHFTRQYISSKTGKMSKNGIHTVFENNETPLEIAKIIHWGCSGTSKNNFDLQPLIEKVQHIVEDNLQ